MVEHVVSGTPPDITVEVNAECIVDLAIELKLFEILYMLSGGLDLMKVCSVRG